jgi:hypothetical protein
MLKTTMLLTLLVSACAMESDSTSTARQATESECDVDGGVKPPEEGPCIIDGVTVDLEALQVAGDRKVTFCHATSSPTNPFVLITTSVNACFAHVTHEHLEQGGHLDIFAGGVCED